MLFQHDVSGPRRGRVTHQRYGYPVFTQHSFQERHFELQEQPLERFPVFGRLFDLPYQMITLDKKASPFSDDISFRELSVPVLRNRDIPTCAPKPSPRTIVFFHHAAEKGVHVVVNDYTSIHKATIVNLLFKKYQSSAIMQR